MLTHKFNISHNYVSDAKYICNVRSQTPTGRTRHKITSDYSDGDNYDLVPVKEKSSPNSRKSIGENNTRHHYVEVPPCPKTQKPRLNLKATFYNNCNEITECVSYHGDDDSPKIFAKKRNTMKENRIKSKNQSKVDEIIYDKESIDLTINNDASDKTLDEIKDLLQTFFVVVKDSMHKNKTNLQKDIGTNSRSDKLEIKDPIKTTSTLPFINNCSGENIKKSSISSVMPIYNSCCYPIMPIYPVNYMQNGCPYPIYSDAFASCLTSKNKTKKYSYSCNMNQNALIKEIYEIVTQNPNKFRKDHTQNDDRNPSKFVKNLSAGSIEIYKESKCDQCLTQSPSKYISKSCEVVGKPFNNFNVKLPETTVDGLIDDTRRSSTDLEHTNSCKRTKEIKACNAKCVLTPRKWRKKERDLADKFNESDIAIDLDIPYLFRRNVADYDTHEQEFYHPAPMNRRNMNNPPYYRNRIRQPNFRNPLGCESELQHHRNYKPQDYTNKNIYNRLEHNPQYSPYYDNSTNYPYQNFNPYCPNMPQEPLCLKEIEVKSTGTQASERKGSLFKKFAHKMNVQQDAQQQENKAPVKKPEIPPPIKAKSGIFSWKSLQLRFQQSLAEEKKNPKKSIRSQLLVPPFRKWPW